MAMTLARRAAVAAATLPSRLPHPPLYGMPLWRQNRSLGVSYPAARSFQSMRRLPGTVGSTALGSQQVVMGRPAQFHWVTTEVADDLPPGVI